MAITMSPFREGLLTGRSVALGGGVARTIADSLTVLGARTEVLDEALDDLATEEWARVHAPLDALVYDSRESFGDAGIAALRAAVDRAWTAVRGIAVGALIPAASAGKVVLVAPAADADPHAGAARAALENTARTLSIEWARFSITTTAIAPGAGTTDAELAALVCFLVSPAGGYFSGCRFELGAVAGAGR